jgi:hypothetical protein
MHSSFRQHLGTRRKAHHHAGKKKKKNPHNIPLSPATPLLLKASHHAGKKDTPLNYKTYLLFFLTSKYFS